MNILIYDPFILWYQHFATNLEIAWEHINKGDNVHFLICESSLSFCESNPEHSLEICTQCHLTRNRGFDKINLPAENIHKLSIMDYQSNITLPEFKTIKELKDFEINGIDFGNAVASSLISLRREPNPALEHEQNFLKELIIDSVAIYHSVYDHLKKLETDIFYLFNGRFATLRPALRAAQNLGIKTFTHEAGGSINKYFLVENNYPHEIDYIKNDINLKWNDDRIPLAEKAQIAEKSYLEKKMGIKQGWYSFTGNQKKNQLPDNFAKNKRNIVFFNSSEDEFQTIESWKNSIYERQNEAIRKIVESVPDKDFHFYLKVHPNLKGISNSQMVEIANLNYPNLTVVPPESDVHSYAMVEAAEKIIVFGSTIGIESVFWDKPVILLGRAFYEDLGGCYIPQDYQETITLILKKDLPPLPKKNALKYAYWEKEFGIPFKYYSPEKINAGKFLGSYLYPQPKDLEELFAVTAEIFQNNFTDFALMEKLLLSVNMPDYNSTYFYQLGFYQYKQARYKEALESFSKSLELGLCDYNLCNYMSECLNETGDKKTAALFYQKALSLKKI
jgi:hypothetical protein